MTRDITDRIVDKLNIPNLIDLLVKRVSFGELQSLLLKVFELKTNNRHLKDLFKDYHSNRFTRPSDINPIKHRKLELTMFSNLPDDFEILDLSPLTPLGTSSILTTVHQNNVVSTIRNVEVAADTTNILALECAKRRKEFLKDYLRKGKTVKLCSSQRLTRGQSFENKNFSAYFNVIALCSAGKDEGNDRFEMLNLEEHLMYYIRILLQLIDRVEVKRIIVKFFSYEGFNNTELIENIKTKLAEQECVNIEIKENSTFGKNYYTRLRFMISILDQSDREFDYIDGGFTDWTSKLLNNKKERILTSGIGTDYLLRTINTID